MCIASGRGIRFYDDADRFFAAESLPDIAMELSLPPGEGEK
jgi:hypothetical protein